MTPAPILQILLDIAFFILLLFSPMLYFYWSRMRAGHLSASQWAALMALLMMAGFIARITILAVIAALVLIAIGIAWVWHRLILADLHYERRFERTHLFPGETTHVTWRLANEKPLPMSWLRWQEAIRAHPFAFGRQVEGLHFKDMEIGPIFDGTLRGLDEVTSLGAFQTLLKTVEVQGLRRGYYEFGKVELQASDALGLYTDTMEVGRSNGLVVYPRLFSAEDLDIPMGALLGETRQRQSFIEDPSWYRGARDYQPSDPIKWIDWKATARAQELQVKLFEPAAHPKLMIMANLHAFEHIWEGAMTDRMEDVISVAGSIAQWALEAGFEVGLNTNGALPGADVPLRILPSAAEDQLFAILDYLARIVLVVQRRIEDLLEAESCQVPYGSTIVVCSSIVTGALAVALAALARSQRVVLVLVDASPAGAQGPGRPSTRDIPNVTIVHATPPWARAA